MIFSFFNFVDSLEKVEVHRARHQKIYVLIMVIGPYGVQFGL